MLRLSRLLTLALPAVMALGVTAAPPAEASSGCSGLCSVYGWVNSSATRISPCANFGGNVCYNITWTPTVQASSLQPGDFTATTSAGGGFTAACFFISPVQTSCSASGSTFSQTVPPNSTTCQSYSSELRNLTSLVATDYGSACRTVGS
jgi:hypothetical protein